jgi:DNA-directed RNA polymerase specialized sigma24 family protein
LEQLTASQIAEWEAYDRLDPIGEWRNDFKFAYLASIITNLMIRAYGKKGSELTKLDDFLIKWDGSEQEVKRQSVEEMKQVMLNLMASQNKDKNLPKTKVK